MKKVYLIFIFNLIFAGVFGQGISLMQQRKLMNALNDISNLYVDSINDKNLSIGNNSSFEDLDPHSSIFLAKKWNGSTNRWKASLKE